MRNGRARFYIGLMSGTSADGIDAVVARIAKGEMRLTAEVVAHAYRPFSPKFHRRILELSTGGTVGELCQMNFLLGHEFAEAALVAVSKAKLRPRDIAAIGSHGQTVRHLPKSRIRSTLQIGEPAVIAERTGILTVADFRVADVASGGQGAPLVAFADWALLTDKHRPRIIQNIGGIGNLTFLPADGDIREVIAFDTGPGNMVIDALVDKFSKGRRKFDLDGRWAARGSVSAELLLKAFSHPFFRRQPPKTTGREEFGESYAERLVSSGRRLGLNPADMLATATAVTAKSIIMSYQRFVFPRLGPGERSRLQVILGGGGARNATLRQMLSSALGSVPLLRHEDFGIGDSAKESLAFALLAYQTLHGRAGNVPGATGARQPAVLGKIVMAREGMSWF